MQAGPCIAVQREPSRVGVSALDLRAELEEISVVCGGDDDEIEGNVSEGF